MQKFVTPHPGRTPSANITDRADYKLNVSLTEYRTEEYLLTISRWIPEQQWQEHRYFLTPAELVCLQAQINGTSKES